MARKISLGTVVGENFRPPPYPETRHGMEEFLNPVSMDLAHFSPVKEQSLSCSMAINVRLRLDSQI